MIPRVLTDPGRFIVSEYGIDVRSAGLDQLVFDASFASIGLAIEGQARLKPRSGRFDWGVETTVFFGRTPPFPGPPMFLFGWTPDDDPTRFHFPELHHYNLTGQRGVKAEVFADRVKFYSWDLEGDDPPSTVRWKALV